jgi:hypothetical protein
LTLEVPDLSPRENRITRNEDLFREVNAHIAKLEDRISIPGDLLPLICECANTGCTTVVHVDPGTFQTVRESPHLFLVSIGHEDDDEAVVGQGAGYVIVQKRPAV